MVSVIYSTHLRRDFQYRSADRFMSDDVRRSPPEGTHTASAAILSSLIEKAGFHGNCVNQSCLLQPELALI